MHFRVFPIRFEAVRARWPLENAPTFIFSARASVLLALLATCDSSCDVKSISVRNRMRKRTFLELWDRVMHFWPSSNSVQWSKVRTLLHSIVERKGVKTPAKFDSHFILLCADYYGRYYGLIIICSKEKRRYLSVYWQLQCRPGLSPITIELNKTRNSPQNRYLHYIIWIVSVWYPKKEDDIIEA